MHVQVRVVRTRVLELRETFLFRVPEQEPLEVLVCRCAVDLRAPDPEEIPLVLLGCANAPEVSVPVVEMVDMDMIRIRPKDVLEVALCDHRDVHIRLAEPLTYRLVEHCEIVTLLQVVPVLLKLTEVRP